MNPSLVRRSPFLSELVPAPIPTHVVASEDVPVDRAAVRELAEFVTVADTCGVLRRAEVTVDDVTCTPDFHKGAGVPIGTVTATTGAVIPAAVGNDVGCGMRLIVTDITRDELRAHIAELTVAARHIFFQGGRDTPTTETARLAALVEGPAAFAEAVAGGPGLWARLPLLDHGADQSHHFELPNPDPGPFDDWARLSSTGGWGRDAVLGSIGGSNHFVEFQSIDQINDRHAAWALGLSPGNVCIMVHTGSVGLGHTCGAIGDTVVTATWPPSTARPSTGPVPVLADSDPAQRWLAAVAAAANFAAVNRYVLAFMAVAALQRSLGRTVAAAHVWDAPHNLVWQTSGTNRFLHRKGAAPAGGPPPGSHLPGEPVLVPGAMGAPSWVLAGTGSALTHGSSCHGAGRQHARLSARRDVGRAREFTAGFPVITPVAVDDPSLGGRRDIVDRWYASIAEEAPWQYKDVTPVVETLTAAGVCTPVARLVPLATIKA